MLRAMISPPAAGNKTQAAGSGSAPMIIFPAKHQAQPVVHSIPLA
jgi:hypothetical protein